jgi:hypothetical protein
VPDQRKEDQYYTTNSLRKKLNSRVSVSAVLLILPLFMLRVAAACFATDVNAASVDFPTTELRIDSGDGSNVIGRGH